MGLKSEYGKDRFSLNLYSRVQLNPSSMCAAEALETISGVDWRS
jgi:hypothetical protein